MKTMRKLTALLAVLGLVLTLWVPVAVAAEVPDAVPSQEKLLYFGRSILEKMDNGEALCYAYDKLTEGCRSLNSSIDIAHRTYRINYDEAGIVYDMVLADHPEFFWLYNGMSMSGSVDWITTFLPNVGSDTAKVQERLETRVQELTVGLDGKSDYDKSVILHDRLCDAVVYTMGPNHQTAIGSLLDGMSVCAGYARGYQLLMQSVGIPCFYVSGYSRNQGHAWNLVQLDGEWYYTDVTWDDQNDDDGISIYYSYLNITYDEMAKDHEADEYAAYLPRSTATAANYYVKNGLILDAEQPVDTYVISRLAAAFKKTYPPQVYYTGMDSHEGASLLFTHLDAIVRKMVGGYYPYSVTVGMLGNVLMVHLVIDHPHQYQTETIPSSCVVNGVAIHRCGDCGYTAKEALPVTDHTYDDDKDPDCNCCGEERVMPTIRYGDINDDGRINNRDLGLLQQYLSSFSVTVNPAACDVTNDGRINNRDLGLLQQYLSGFPVELG